MLLPNSLISALSYGVASMAMVFINKAILMEYSYSMTLLTVQVCERASRTGNKMLHCFIHDLIEWIIMFLANSNCCAYSRWSSYGIHKGQGFEHGYCKEASLGVPFL